MAAGRLDVPIALSGRVETDQHDGQVNQTAKYKVPVSRNRGTSIPSVLLPDALKTYTAVELSKMELPEPRWAVNGLIPEGLSVLAGKPKLGKSWMAVDVMIAIAEGGKTLDYVEVNKGDVLYLALEDGPRRMRDRLQKMHVPYARPDLGSHLFFTHQSPRQDEGGKGAVERWLVEHPDARLVVIDTWAKFKPTRKGRKDLYEEDYRDASDLKELADKHHIAILAIHHARKAFAEDAVDEVSGSNGLTGAADTILTLRRNRNRKDAALSITGRDVEEKELAVWFDRNTCRWEVRGEAEAVSLTHDQMEVVLLLKRMGPLSPKDAAPLLKKTHDATKMLFSRMTGDGKLLRIKRTR